MELFNPCIKIKEESEIKEEYDDYFVKEEHELPDDGQQIKQEKIFTFDNNSELQIKQENSESRVLLDKNSRVSSLGAIDWKPDEKSFIYRDLFRRVDDVKFMYNCLKCNYDTNTKKNFDFHMLAHLDTKLHKCSECSFETNYKNYLKVHISKQHPETIKSLKCSECDFETYEEKTLKFHYKTHLKKLYKCPDCDYTTPVKRHLRPHILLHTGKEVLSCPECDFKTIYEAWLNNHIKKHKNTKSVKLYKCPDCDYVSEVKAQLTKHSFRHKDIVQMKCSKCEYKAIHKDKLNRHIRLKHKQNLIFD